MRRRCDGCAAAYAENGKIFPVFRRATTGARGALRMHEKVENFSTFSGRARKRILASGSIAQKKRQNLPPFCGDLALCPETGQILPRFWGGVVLRKRGQFAPFSGSGAIEKRCGVVL